MSSDDWRVTQLENEVQRLKNDISGLQNTSSTVITATDLECMGWIDPNGMFMTSLGQALSERQSGGYDDMHIHAAIDAYLKTPFAGRMQQARQDIFNFKLE